MAPLSACHWDHPRIRGEHCWVGHPVGGCDGSSPHTRGARVSEQCQTWARPDHPRIRGEHDRLGRLRDQPLGSSPHTRGAPGMGAVQKYRGGIIPAYAGSTKDAYRAIARAAGSSPHTRGARPGRRRRCDVPGIIPAYAGSTPQARLCRPRARDHPRIRGEHANALVAASRALGSSPHTRGAQHGGLQRLVVLRIIPAYAGSTTPRNSQFV